MKRTAILTLALLSAPVFAGEPPAAPEKAVVCAACHGQTGVSTQPIYPSLAGQYANYLEHSLHEYKSGKRKNPIMGAQAAGLTNQDIKQLSAYFAAQQGPLYTPNLPVEHK